MAFAGYVSFDSLSFRHGGHASGILHPLDLVPLDLGVLATISGTSGNDSLTGGSGADSLSGLAGNDTLTGNGGNDTLNGGSGTDRMVGGAGNDLYAVDALSDVVVEAAGGGVDTVKVMTFFYVLPANVENMTCAAAYGSQLIGNDLNNTISGSSHGDLLVGLGGNDTLKGGQGDDTYYVENKGDVVTEGSNAGYDTIATDLSVYTMPANVEELFGYSTLGLSLTGNALDNYIEGDRGNDTLKGADGNDTLEGDIGSDVLTGGAGIDDFYFVRPLSASNVDTITDFNPLDDWIDLENTGTGMFNALTTTGYLASTAFKLIGPGGSAVDSSDRILYNQSTGQLYYDPDGSGGAAMIQFAVIANHAALTADNFWVF